MTGTPETWRNNDGSLTQGAIEWIRDDIAKYDADIRARYRHAASLVHDEQPDAVLSLSGIDDEHINRLRRKHQEYTQRLIDSHGPTESMRFGIATHEFAKRDILGILLDQGKVNITTYIQSAADIFEVSPHGYSLAEQAPDAFSVIRKYVNKLEHKVYGGTGLPYLPQHTEK